MTWQCPSHLESIKTRRFIPSFDIVKSIKILAIFSQERRKLMITNNNINERLLSILEEVKIAANNPAAYDNAIKELRHHKQQYKWVGSNRYIELFYDINYQSFTLVPTFGTTFFLCRFLAEKESRIDLSQDFVEVISNTILYNLNKTYLTQINSGNSGNYTNNSVSIDGPIDKVQRINGYLLPEYISSNIFVDKVLNNFDSDFIDDPFIKSRIQKLHSKFIEGILTRIPNLINNDMNVLFRMCTKFSTPNELFDFVIQALSRKFSFIDKERFWRFALHLRAKYNLKIPKEFIPKLRNYLQFIVNNLPYLFFSEFKNRLEFAELYYIVTGERLIVNANCYGFDVYLAKYLGDNITPNIDFHMEFIKFENCEFEENELRMVVDSNCNSFAEIPYLLRSKESFISNKFTLGMDFGYCKLMLKTQIQHNHPASNVLQNLLSIIDKFEMVDMWNFENSDVPNDFKNAFYNFNPSLLQ